MNDPEQYCKDVEIRLTEAQDAPYLTSWLKEPGILRWFPMFDDREIDDGVNVWINYAKLQAALTADYKGVPCGMAVLYLQPYVKLAHQCVLAIIVSSQHRGKGVGTLLLQALMRLAKDKFDMEMLHLEVYQGNPAIHLYRRLGFEEFGYQSHFIKDNDEYIGKIYMQKIL
ncbi:MAG: N-acetyltransferase family protein [Anaerolineae bacterium]